jgi:hypothetical protein
MDEIETLFYSILTEYDQPDVFSKNQIPIENRKKIIINNKKSCMIFLLNDLYKDDNNITETYNTNLQDIIDKINSGTFDIPIFCSPEILEKKMTISSNIFNKNTKHSFLSFSQKIIELNDVYGKYFFNEDKFSIYKQSELMFKLGKIISGYYCNKNDLKRSIMIYTILIKITLSINKMFFFHHEYVRLLNFSALVLKTCIGFEYSGDIDEYMANAEKPNILFCVTKLYELILYKENQSIVSTKEFCFISKEFPWYFKNYKTSSHELLVKVCLSGVVLSAATLFGIPWIYPTFSLGYLVYDNKIKNFLESNKDVNDVIKYCSKTISISDIVNKINPEKSDAPCTNDTIDNVKEMILKYEQNLDEHYNKYISLLIIYKKLFNLICGSIELNEPQYNEEEQDEINTKYTEYAKQLNDNYVSYNSRSKNKDKYDIFMSLITTITNELGINISECQELNIANKEYQLKPILDILRVMNSKNIQVKKTELYEILCRIKHTRSNDDVNNSRGGNKTRKYRKHRFRKSRKYVK